MRVQARILLVDDNEVDFVFTRRMLTRLSSADPTASEYEIDWAASVDEALQVLSEGKHDVCLVDYQLGDRDGLDLLREASRRGIGVPMIVLTGRGDPDIDSKAMALGASGYLDKETIDSRQLDRALRYALSRENLIQTLLDQNEELLHFHKLTEIALGSNDFAERLGEMAKQLSRASNFPGIEFTSYDPKQRSLTPLASCSHGKARAALPYAVDGSVSGGVVSNRKPRVEMGLEGSLPSSVLERWPGARSFVSLPLLSNGTVIGAVELSSDQAMVVDSAQLERLSRLANHVGLLLDPVLEHADLTSLRTKGLQAPDPSGPTVDEILAIHASCENPGVTQLPSSEPLAGELKALLSWYGREAADQGMELHLEAVSGDHQNLRGDAVRLRRVISTYLNQALRFGDQGRVIVQTMPPAGSHKGSEEVLVSFRLPDFKDSVREWQPCLESGRELVESLGGQLETISESCGGLRVLMSASLATPTA